MDQLTSDEPSGIKIITDPSVYLIASQQINADELDQFLADHGVTWKSDSEVAAEVITETAGRTCYLSFAKPRPGGNEAYLKHIKESRHGSVLEHAVWTFMITGVSRSLTHEFVRHRAGFAYSQLSQRYVDESIAEYVEPDLLTEYQDLHEIWLDAMAYAHAAYVKLVAKIDEKFKGSNMLPTEPTARRKAIRQAARSVLPNATETKITVTGNARALRHFLEQRGSEFAEPEIRKLAVKMLDILQVEAPNIFGDYECSKLPDGSWSINTEFRKV